MQNPPADPALPVGGRVFEDSPFALSAVSKSFAVSTCDFFSSPGYRKKNEAATIITGIVRMDNSVESATLRQAYG